MVDIAYIRGQFPILETKVRNKYPLVYLDNAATTQKPFAVINALLDYYTKYNANVHRGVHYLSGLATDMFEQSRDTVRAFINASCKEEIVFTRGTTESINLVAHSFCKTFLTKQDTVMITQMEHHSNIVPWQIARDNFGFKLDYLTFDDNGELENLKEKILSVKPKLLSLCHISNTLGTVNDIKEIIAFCHQNGCLVLIDGAQSVAHQIIDVQDLDADFFVFSGHKVYAPMGIGVLYAKKDILETMDVYHGGGEMIKEVTMEKTTYNDLPYKFEAGTPSVADAVGLAAALSWLKSMDMPSIISYEDSLLQYAEGRLKEIKGIRIFGNAKHKSSCISFLADGVHHLDLGTLLDAMGVAIRTGHHCAEPVMQRFGIEGTDRLSVAAYTSHQEIDTFISSLNKALGMLR
ncbi:MAG: SufS family cysteine desulfurase [Bacteroidales bacterium]|nr:SufS family cysteine desulfurase [Bacteroidales bacterium]